MPEEFVTIDKSALGQLIGSKRCGSLGARDLIMGAVGLGLLLLCLLFVGLYFSYKPPEAQKDLCETRDCMKSAAQAVELMNKSANPCDNFYQYACGNYKTYNPRTGWWSRSVRYDLYKTTYDRLMSLITKKDTWNTKGDFHAKIINFYQSCMDQHTREQKAGRPLLKIIKDLGGWYVLGTWNETNWDINDFIKKADADYWVMSLVVPWLRLDPSDHTKRIISLSVAQPQLMYPSSFTKWYFSHEKRYYTTFVKRVAKLLVRDDKSTKLPQKEIDTRVQQFVDDTLAVAVKFAQVQHTNWWDRDGGGSAYISDLNSWAGDSIDVQDQLSYFFKTKMSQYTKVTLDRKKGVKGMYNVVKTVMAMPDGKRMMHNYLIMKLAETYLRYLSQDYEMADHELFKFLHNRGRSYKPMMLCFGVVLQVMKDAVSAVYVQEHLDGGSKQKVTDITSTMKEALQQELDKASWMDESTRDYAKQKLDKVIYKIGHPKGMEDPEHVDEMFSDLSISRGDFFDNILSGIKRLHHQYVKMYEHGEDKQKWVLPPYWPRIRVNYRWNDLTIPAGLLQDPIWGQNTPHYFTFGSLGTSIGRYLVNIISDSRGRQRGLDGSKKSWWSHKSSTKLKTIQDCIIRGHENATSRKIYYSYTRERTSLKMFSVISGVRVALKAYKDWMGTEGVEKMVPGLNLTPKQAFFLSFAQSHCHNLNWWHKMSIHSGYYDAIADLQINMALGQLPEFSDAFSCPVDSKMNEKTKCTYY